MIRNSHTDPGIGSRRYSLVCSAPPLIKRIQQIVAKSYAIHENFLCGVQSNNRRHVAPRQIAAYFCRQLGEFSYPEIGVAFGQHHTTIMSSVRRVESRLSVDPEFGVALEKLKRVINREDDLPVTLEIKRVAMPEWALALIGTQRRIEAKLDKILSNEKAEAA